MPHSGCTNERTFDKRVNQLSRFLAETLAFVEQVLHRIGGRRQLAAVGVVDLLLFNQTHPMSVVFLLAAFASFVVADCVSGGYKQFNTTLNGKPLRWMRFAFVCCVRCRFTVCFARFGRARLAQANQSPA